MNLRRAGKWRACSRLASARPGESGAWPRAHRRERGQNMTHEWDDERFMAARTGDGTGLCNRFVTLLIALY